MYQDTLKDCLEHPQKITLPNKQQDAVWRKLHPYSQILFINVCLHLKRCRDLHLYDVEICIGMDLGLLIQIYGQFCYMNISALD